MFVDKILDNRQEKIEELLQNFTPLLSAKHSSENLNLMKTFNRVYHYSDEIKLFHYSGSLGSIKSFSDGIDIDEYSASGYSVDNNELALMKFIGEALERTSQRIYKKKDLVPASYQNISSNAVNIFSIAAMSKKQLQRSTFERFNFNEKSNFRWTKCIDIKSGKEILIPAQLVYLGYNFGHEKLIYIPTTTGTAGGGSFTMALFRALCELIERDQFMITYLAKISPPRIRLSSIKDQKTKDLIKYVQKYNFELHLLDLTLDLEVPTFLALIIDRTGFGTGVSLGLKTHVDPYEAIKGSIIEASHPRGWIRRIVDDQPELLENFNPNKIISIRDRALYWYPKSKIKDLEFLLKGKERNISRIDKNIENLSSSEKTTMVIEKLLSKGMDVYYKDITFGPFKELGYNVVRVVVPQSIQFYLDERFPCLGGSRLYSVPKSLGYASKDFNEDDLNKIPHPFL